MWEEPNKVTVWGTTQAPYMDKGSLFHVFNRQVEVRCIGNHTGGSFGTKVMCWQVQAYAALLSRATGRSVKVMFTKEEHMAAFVTRIGSRIHAKVGMKKDGSLTAIQGSWYVDSGYYSFTTQAQVAVGSGELMIMAQCPNWDLKNTVVVTNRNASGITRGFGGQELKCSFIPLLCLAMEKADLDPFEVLKKNFVKPVEGTSGGTATGMITGASTIPQPWRRSRTIRMEREMEGWLTPTAVIGTKRIGIGVGVHGNADVGEDAQRHTYSSVRTVPPRYFCVLPSMVPVRRATTSRWWQKCFKCRRIESP